MEIEVGDLAGALYKLASLANDGAFSSRSTPLAQAPASGVGGHRPPEVVTAVEASREGADEAAVGLAMAFLSKQFGFEFDSCTSPLPTTNQNQKEAKPSEAAAPVVDNNENKESGGSDSSSSSDHDKGDGGAAFQMVVGKGKQPPGHQRNRHSQHQQNNPNPKSRPQPPPTTNNRDRDASLRKQWERDQVLVAVHRLLNHSHSNPKMNKAATAEAAARTGASLAAAAVQAPHRSEAAGMCTIFCFHCQLKRAKFVMSSNGSLKKMRAKNKMQF